MFNFLLPGKSKKILSESELIFSSLQRNRIYSQDILTPKNLEAIDELESRYKALRKAKDIDGLEQWNADAMKFGNRAFPPSPWDGWRENVEVFVVAAIMALSIRTFFLQPFKIPTGSMEPTLFGIEPLPATELPPNPLVQTFDFLIHGKTYSRVVTKQGGTITGLTSGTMTIWFEYTDVHMTDANGNTEVDRIWIRDQDVMQKLHLFPNSYIGYDGKSHEHVYPPGAVLANYVTQTGDQVLVDKVSYNFHPPSRGDVIIFKTAGIPKLTNERGPNQEGSEDFIKRCIGFAGDLVTIKPPLLYVNGQLATGAPSFAKEFARSDNYPGYSLYDIGDNVGSTEKDSEGNETQTYYVPADCYWAMGDNSPNSKDSRNWGGVPRQNLVGRGYFVFWPFTSRWGWIK